MDPPFFSIISLDCRGGGGLWVDYFYIEAAPSLRNTHLSISDWFYNSVEHENVIKWKHFPRYWLLLVRSPVNSAHKCQWRGDLMVSLICARINGWVNNGKAGDLRRHCTHYAVIVMDIHYCFPWILNKSRSNKFHIERYICAFSWLAHVFKWKTMLSIEMSVAYGL